MKPPVVMIMKELSSIVHSGSTPAKWSRLSHSFCYKITMNVMWEEQWTLMHSLKSEKELRVGASGTKTDQRYPILKLSLWISPRRLFTLDGWRSSDHLMLIFVRYLVFNSTVSTPGESWPLWNSARRNNGCVTMQHQSPQPWLACISRVKWRVLYEIWQL